MVDRTLKSNYYYCYWSVSALFWWCVSALSRWSVSALIGWSVSALFWRSVCQRFVLVVCQHFVRVVSQHFVRVVDQCFVLVVCQCFVGVVCEPFVRVDSPKVWLFDIKYSDTYFGGRKMFTSYSSLARLRTSLYLETKKKKKPIKKITFYTQVECSSFNLICFVFFPFIIHQIFFLKSPVANIC